MILLDMLEVRRGIDARYIPIKILQPTIQRRVIVPYTLQHQLEVLLVYGIEADKSRVEFDVHLSWLRSAWDVKMVFCSFSIFSSRSRVSKTTTAAES